MTATGVRPLRVLIAPLIWIERVRGRRRLALLTLYALIAAAIALLAWRASRLSDLPDIGDPFDLAPVLAVDVPGDRNAFTLWKEASARARSSAEVETRILHGPYTGSDPAVAEILELWRKGAERPDAMLARPGDMRLETRIGTILEDHRRFSMLALTAGSGCVDRGDMEGAWTWYRAVLRASRLIGRNGSATFFRVGMSEYEMTSRSILAWAADGRVDAAMLRRALGEVIAINRLSARPSDVLRIDYLSMRHSLNHPGYVFDEFVRSRTREDVASDFSGLRHLTLMHHLAWFAGNELERTRRLQRLAYANWLRDCDEPPAVRPGIVASKRSGAEFYDQPSSRSAGGISGVDLARRVDESRVASLHISDGVHLPPLADGDLASRADLVVELASTLYQREHGRPPALLDALVGPYLERLPEGYVAPPPTPPQP